MNYITHIHLENRILVGEDSEADIISLSQEHNIPVVLGTDGNYESGPFIERIYKKTECTLTIEQFQAFVKELVPLIDLYRGVKVFTYIELTMKVVIEIEGKPVHTPIRTEVAVYMDPESNIYHIQSLKPDVEKIRKLNPWQQKRITLDTYQEDKMRMLSIAPKN